MNETMLWEYIQLQLIQMTIAVISVGVIATCFMRMRPHLAHLLLLVVLLKCLTPPLLPQFIPLPTASSSRPIVTVSDSASNQVPPANDLVLVTMNDEPVVTTGMTHVPRQAAANGSIGLTMARVALVVWALVSLRLLAMALASARLSRRRWAESAILVDEPLRRRFERIKDLVGIDRNVELVVNRNEFGPLVAGWWKPVVVIPRSIAVDASRQDLDLALAHELVHLRRGDLLTSLLQLTARSIWWFHPGVWWLCTMIDRSSEQCCDDEVIAAMRCKPANYANFLVSILERKHLLRQAIGFPGARPAQVSRQRLKRLNKPTAAFLPHSPWYYRVLFVGLAIVLLPGRPSSSATPSSDQPEKSAPVVTGPKDLSKEQHADALFASQAWEAAIVRYREILHGRPSTHAKPGLAWYRLGHALRRIGKNEEAMEALLKAAEFPLGRSRVYYELARVHAAKAKPDQALAAFERAIENGYRSVETDIERDLKSIAGTPKYDELVTRATMHRRLDFLAGTWEVRDQDDKLLGRSVITKGEQGNLLTEKWEAASGSTGTGISYYEPQARVWKQTYVGMFGNIMTMQGTYSAGVLRMTGQTVYPNRSVVASRAVTTKTKDGFRYTLEESRDGGQTWRRTFDGFYNRP